MRAAEVFSKPQTEPAFPAGHLKPFHSATSESYLLHKQGSKWNIWDFIPSSISSGQKNGWGNTLPKLLTEMNKKSSNILFPLELNENKTGL